MRQDNTAVENIKRKYRKSPTFHGLQVDKNESSRILGYLPAAPGKYKTRRGRGTGSGTGNTSTRGHKGQGQRGKAKIGFEGGQTPWYKRVPKMGFTPLSDGVSQTVSVTLERLLNIMNKHSIDNISTEQILKFINAPFPKKFVKVIGTVENMSVTVNIECEAMSKGAEACLRSHKSSFKRREGPRPHSMRKKTY